MYHSFSRKDSLQDAARSILEASEQKHPLDESIQRGANVHIKSSGKMGVVLAVVGDRLTVKLPGEEEAQILSVDEVELFQGYDESTELEEAYKKGEKVKILLNPEDEHDTGEDNADAKWGEGEIVQSWGHDEYDVKLLSNDSFAGHYKKGDTIPQIYGAQLRPLDESTELTELEEPTKEVEKLSGLSDDEKAKIEDILTRRDKNMPAGMKNRKRHPILMFDKHGQYHGSYASVSDAEEKIKRVGDTEGWINGPRLVQVDESTELTEASMIDQLQDILDNHSATPVKTDDGKRFKVDPTTAKAILTVYKALNKQNQKKTEEMMSKSKVNFMKLVDFAWRQVESTELQEANDDPFYKHMADILLGETVPIEFRSEKQKSKVIVPANKRLTTTHIRMIADLARANDLIMGPEYQSTTPISDLNKMMERVNAEIDKARESNESIEKESTELEEVSVQKMLDAEDRETGKFYSMSDMTLAFDENPEGSTSQVGDGVIELDGFNAAGWQYLDGKYAVRVGGGYMIYSDLEAAKAYAKDDWS